MSQSEIMMKIFQIKLLYKEQGMSNVKSEVLVDTGKMVGWGTKV
jgi:hypothetical protein